MFPDQAALDIVRHALRGPYNHENCAGLLVYSERLIQGVIEDRDARRAHLRVIVPMAEGWGESDHAE